ncbi:hypothetical protein WJX79_002267 [Trebouxia sp. C0005]|nr:MAG: hypothetical protein FRX49_09464 [Trebouxia sp. A1-2]
MVDFRYVDGSSLPTYFREGLFPLVRHAFAQTKRLCKSSDFDDHWAQVRASYNPLDPSNCWLNIAEGHDDCPGAFAVYSISAKYHSIKQKLKGNQYIPLDTDRFNGILDELTMWLHSSPAARQQAAEHWADRHGMLGQEHSVADRLDAAQQ